MNIRFKASGRMLFSEVDGECLPYKVGVSFDNEKDLQKFEAVVEDISIFLAKIKGGENPNWGRIRARLGAEGIPSAQLKIKYNFI